MPVLKMLPLLASLGAIAMLLGYALKPYRTTVAIGSATGLVAGIAGAAVMVTSFPGSGPFDSIRAVIAGIFLLFWAWAVAAVYRAAGSTFHPPVAFSLFSTRGHAVACSVSAGIIMGAIAACRFAPQGKEWPIGALCVFAVAGGVTIFIGNHLAPILPASFKDKGSAAAVLTASLLFFAAAFVPRIDLFSPLVMKVMKFIHDFIHQFFESMLIPDHLFFRPHIWNYIGILFGNKVGFWGGAAIWFTPVVLIAIAIRIERLPSVAHIRQGAERRMLLAKYLRERRKRLMVPLCSAAILAAAVYQSRFPAIEYWDPQPIKVSAGSSGVISIAPSADVNLKDGRIHKFIVKQGGREARFMVLMTPGGELTVTLDACSICKPDGYGQAEGAVICYYCNTLIPLETVGKPGGCNPVPVPFSVDKEEIRIDSATLLNRWIETVQATTRIKGERR